MSFWIKASPRTLFFFFLSVSICLATGVDCNRLNLNCIRIMEMQHGRNSRTGKKCKTMMKPMECIALRTTSQLKYASTAHSEQCECFGLILLHQYWIPFSECGIKKTYKIENQFASNQPGMARFSCVWPFGGGTLFDKSITCQFISRVYDLQNGQLYYEQHKHHLVWATTRSVNDKHSTEKN